MLNGDTPQPAEAPVASETSPVTVEPPEDVPPKSKEDVRSRVWRSLSRTKQSAFPYPTVDRIPNFKGAMEAAQRLAELDVFKNATGILVNANKSQEPVRIMCMEHKKTLYVMVPRQPEGLMKKLEFPLEDVKEDKPYKVVTRNGLTMYGKNVGLDDEINIDLVVMGAVAVSKDGSRIGKGRGFADLEFAMLTEMKAIKPNAKIVTTVHDLQVFDTLPVEFFGPHDVPVDIIVTPDQVIETQRLGQRPPGILWHLLSNRKITAMPILKQFMEKEILAGRPCVLKEVDTDMEEENQGRPFKPRFRRFMPRYRKNTNSQSDQNEDPESGERREPGDRPPRRYRPRPRPRDSAPAAADAQASPDTTRPRPRPRRYPRNPVHFALKVTNIDQKMRLKDLRTALAERGLKPQRYVWKGFRGICFLQFGKPIPKKGEGDSAVPATGEEVCALLAGLTVQCSVSAEGEGQGEVEHKPCTVNVELLPPRLPREAAVPQITPV